MPALRAGFRDAKSFIINGSEVLILLGVQEVPGSNPGSPTKPFHKDTDDFGSRAKIAVDEFVAVESTKFRDCVYHQEHL